MNQTNLNKNGPFPEIVINNIALFLPPEDVCKSRLVCQLWNRSILPSTIELKKLEFEQNNKITIEVKYLTGQSLKLQLQRTDKISKIRLALQDRFGTIPEQAILLLPKCAWQLGDDYTIKEYNIITGTTIYCNFTHRPIRPPGTPQSW